MLISVQRCSGPEPSDQLHFVGQMGALCTREPAFGLQERKRKRLGRGRGKWNSAELRGAWKGVGFTEKEKRMIKAGVRSK